MFKPEWSDELKKPLLDKYVQKRTQSGMTLSYITSHHAIREMNTIFGHGEWSYQVDRLDMVANEKNQRGNHVVTYLAVVTVTVNGTSRQDTGSGSGIGKDLGKAHEGASKEAVSDALKRCLRTFGDRLGLALYDKDQKHVVNEKDEMRKELFIKEVQKMLESKTATRKDVKKKIAEGLSSQFITIESDIVLKCTEKFKAEDDLKKEAEEDINV
ncbi:RAD52 family DNA repair protein [bacterium]|nr:RAD52 family DNA repair protein [bacterium]